MMKPPLLLCLRDAIDAMHNVIDAAKSEGRPIPDWLKEVTNQLGVEYEVIAAKKNGSEPILVHGERATL